MIIAQKDQLIANGDEFGDYVKQLFNLSSLAERYNDEAAQPHWDKSSKEYRKILVQLSGARSEKWLAIGALIAAQKSQETRHVDDETIHLMEAWRGTVLESIIRTNDKITSSSEVEGPMPRGERWVGSWPLGSGSFGTTACEQMIQPNAIFETLC